MSEAEILFETRGKAGIVTLNRPKALNAVTRLMVDQLHAKLIDWAGDPAIETVVIKAAGEKAFSAGGDIRQLYDWGQQKNPAIRDFYRKEYRLNTFIKTYPKPYVALIDGIVMGGGVGVSFHGSHRVGGSKLMFAMPETGIGLFPDVGGTWFLSRLPHRIGTWLALTGARLGQADALWCGLTTNAVSTEHFGDVETALAAGGALDDVLDPFAVRPEGATLPGLAATIEHCFAGETVETILDALDGDGGEWAAKQAAIIRTKSPTSLKIALRQMQEGAKADFETCMKIEFRIVSRVVEGHEFFEGVRAVIIDKDNKPDWQPATLAAVSDADIDAYFAPLPDELDLTGVDRS
ncbi:enoyl-CoA hydratase/isomerase family protein [Mesorhizobium sp. YIM 152430]|uniref:enoyl-CoA hydratase/isomerase family protein n=1 Tax=Mesorhizobium sp. YIM 152430 TaxID=3031761 RepID=UPI0023DBB0DF|nr:enoyl-CoA hydratase/isomerase family protein [Mesorhizobium sp. YIM 152430]MDF1601185.1 enoyl-CoA hydratase/isomerase family protein [Mesorhizobium sp. YIM 152430]